MVPHMRWNMHTMDMNTMNMAIMYTPVRVVLGPC